MPVFPGDSKLAVPNAVALLPDSRVIHYWDQTRMSGSFFKRNIAPDVSSKVAWDMFFLYGPKAVWEEIPEPLVDKGRTIIGSSGALGYEFGELMKNMNKKTG